MLLPEVAPRLEEVGEAEKGIEVSVGEAGVEVGVTRPLLITRETGGGDKRPGVVGVGGDESSRLGEELDCCNTGCSSKTSEET